MQVQPRAFGQTKFVQSVFRCSPIGRQGAASKGVEDLFSNVFRVVCVFKCHQGLLVVVQKSQLIQVPVVELTAVRASAIPTASKAFDGPSSAVLSYFGAPIA